MSTIHPAIPDIASSVTTTICRRFRGYVDREDIVQECYSWYLSRTEHLDTLLNEENTVQRVINEKRLAWQMRRHCERYARKEKAIRSGYKPGDEAFYDTVVIAQLLPHVIASVVDNTVLEQAQNLINDGQPKKQSAPAKNIFGVFGNRKGYLSRFVYCPYCGEKVNWKQVLSNCL